MAVRVPQSGHRPRHEARNSRYPKSQDLETSHSGRRASPLKFEKIQPQTFQLEFSPDGKRLAVLGDTAQPLLFDAATGDPLPKLENADYLSVYYKSFSADGRLFAASGGRSTVTTQTIDGREKLKVGSDSNFVCVWDTETGKVLKNWDRTCQVAFHPSKPLLATLEPNGADKTRLGLWDFSADTEKK